jgi:acetolactate synthase-1/2/3 large subunit
LKASDYIAKTIKKETNRVFGVTGGCIVNLVNSFEENGVDVIPVHHEQSASIAADAYARIKGYGVSFGTSGPGTTNLLTGVCCSYYDSIPTLAIGGQVPSKYLNSGKDRQTGFQEVDGVTLFRPVTKYSKRMTHPKDLEDAIRISKKPRRGPSFLEICDDYQREEIAKPVKSYEINMDLPKREKEINLKADKPLVIVGAGARDAQLELDVPFLYTWGMKDKLYHHENCKGDFGVTGSPNGNRLIKESDLILMIGTRMDTHKVPDWSKFAPNAYKIAIGLDFPHKADQVIDTPLDFPIRISGKKWGKREENTSTGEVYEFIDELNNLSSPGDIIIPDMGQTGCIAFQRWKPKERQRLFNGMNHSPMGYALSASIGAGFCGDTIIIIGDGSFMMNIQDLQTIKDYNLPVKTFVINNGGYGMIRQTQKDWKVLKNGVACNFKIPDLEKLADAFGITYCEEFEAFNKHNLGKPTLTEIRVDDSTIKPKWRYGTEL